MWICRTAEDDPPLALSARSYSALAGPVLGRSRVLLAARVARSGEGSALSMPRPEPWNVNRAFQ